MPQNININFKFGKYLCEFENPQTYANAMKQFAMSKKCKNHKIDFRFYFNAKAYQDHLNKTGAEVCHILDDLLEKVLRDMPEDVKDEVKSDWINIDRHIFATLSS
jgi:hypothetical protein